MSRILNVHRKGQKSTFHHCPLKGPAGRKVMSQVEMQGSLLVVVVGGPFSRVRLRRNVWLIVAELTEEVLW